MRTSKWARQRHRSGAPHWRFSLKESFEVVVHNERYLFCYWDGRDVTQRDVQRRVFECIDICMYLYWVPWMRVLVRCEGGKIAWSSLYVFFIFYQSSSSPKCVALQRGKLYVLYIKTCQYSRPDRMLPHINLIVIKNKCLILIMSFWSCHDASRRFFIAEDRCTSWRPASGFLTYFTPA